MPVAFEQTFVVQNHECDTWGRMKPGDMLRRAQEISIQHSNALGLTSQVYTSTNTVFLLSKISLIIHKAPNIGETVCIQTNAYGMQRAVFHRITGIYNQQGQLLCEVDSNWLLVDTINRRILRTPPENFPMPFTDTDYTPHDAFKMPHADALQVVGQGFAAYTLCDTNRHVNNAVYADLICNALPLSIIEKDMPARFVLVYHHEIPLGQSFVLSSQSFENGTYFTAQQDDKNNFEAFVFEK